MLTSGDSGVSLVSVSDLGIMENHQDLVADADDMEFEISGAGSRTTTGEYCS